MHVGPRYLWLLGDRGLDAGPGGPPLLVLVAGTLRVVVEAAHPTHQVHPAGHLLLSVRRKVVNPPGGADIEHVLEPQLAALECEARVNLEPNIWYDIYHKQGLEFAAPVRTDQGLHCP